MEGAPRHRLLPSQQLSGELDMQADVLETLLSYLEVAPHATATEAAPSRSAVAAWQMPRVLWGP